MALPQLPQAFRPPGSGSDHEEYTIELYHCRVEPDFNSQEENRVLKVRQPWVVSQRSTLPLIVFHEKKALPCALNSNKSLLMR